VTYTIDKCAHVRETERSYRKRGTPLIGYVIRVMRKISVHEITLLSLLYNDRNIRS